MYPFYLQVGESYRETGNRILVVLFSRLVCNGRRGGACRRLGPGRPGVLEHRVGQCVGDGTVCHNWRVCAHAVAVRLRFELLRAQLHPVMLWAAPQLEDARGHARRNRRGHCSDATDHVALQRHRDRVIRWETRTCFAARDRTTSTRGGFPAVSATARAGGGAPRCAPHATSSVVGQYSACGPRHSYHATLIRGWLGQETSRTRGR